MSLHMNQTQLEEALRAGVDALRYENADNINGWLYPVFRSCDAAEGTFVCSFEPGSSYANTAGTLHGGVIALLLDNAMGLLADLYCPGMSPTITLDINYLRSISIGQPIFVRAHVDKAGRSLTHLSAEMYYEDAPERKLVTAASVYIAG